MVAPAIPRSHVVPLPDALAGFFQLFAQIEHGSQVLLGQVGADITGEGDLARFEALARFAQFGLFSVARHLFHIAFLFVRLAVFCNCFELDCLSFSLVFHFALISVSYDLHHSAHFFFFVRL